MACYEESENKRSNIINESFNSSSFHSEVIENDDCFADENEIQKALEKDLLSSSRSFEEKEINKPKQLLRPFILSDYLKYNDELRKILELDLQKNQIMAMINNIMDTDMETSMLDLSTLKEQIELYRIEHKNKLLSMIQEESKENIVFSTIQPLTIQEELSKSQIGKEELLSIEVVKEIDEYQFKNNNPIEDNKSTKQMNKEIINMAKDNDDNNNDRNDITDNLKPINVYERLYNKRKIFKLDIVEVPIKLTKCNTNNNIKKNRRECFERLNRDIERRNTSKKENEAKRGQNKTTNQINKIQVKQNISANKLLYNKYTQSYNQIITELQTASLIKSNSSFTLEDIILIFQRLNLIIQQLHVIDISPNSRTTTSSYHKQEDIKKIQELFDSIKEPNQLRVLNHNLFLFSLSILNLIDYHYSLQNNINRRNTQQHVTTISENKKYSSFDSKGNLLISPFQSKYIFKDFQSMYQNWKKTFYHYHHSNNQNSNQMEIKKSKSKNKYNDQSRSFNQDSINRQLLQYKQHQSKMALLKQENESKELINCTFKPILTRYMSRDFALSKFLSVSTKMSRQKSKANIESKQEREKKEYTFKPRINNINVKHVKELYSKINSQQISFENEKHNERMLQGRREREIKINAFKLRDNYNSANKSFKNNSNKKYTLDIIKTIDAPQSQMKESTVNLHAINYQLYANEQVNVNKKLLVIIDIKINNENKRLMVYEGDTAEDLSKKFIVDNSK